MRLSSQSKNRIYRTGAQAVVSGVAAEAITELLGDFIPPATLAALLFVIVAYVQNWIEDRGISIPGVPDRV